MLFERRNYTKITFKNAKYLNQIKNKLLRNGKDVLVNTNIVRREFTFGLNIIFSIA